MRILTLLTTTGVLSLVACNGGVRDIDYWYPETDLSTSRLEFGNADYGQAVTRELVIVNSADLAMGIGGIALGEDEMEENFSFTWSPSLISCPDDADGGDGGDGGSTGDDTAGSGDGGSGDTGPTGDDTGPATEGLEEVDGIVVLEPGCKVPVEVTMTPRTVGDIYGSLHIYTVTEESEDYDRAFYRDPDQFHRVVLLHGEALRGAGNIVATRTLDFGYVWNGKEETGIVAIRNVGDGDLTLGEPELSATCDDAYEVTWSYWTDSDQAGNDEYFLEAGQQTFLEVTYLPQDQDSAYCSVTIPSNDEDEPTVSTTIKGNTGDNPNCADPTVSIRSPETGYVHLSADDIEIELNVFDQNQPASTLSCKVKSFLLGGAIADCTPTDDTGHVVLTLGIDEIEQGADTLQVVVTNDCDRTAYASTTIQYRNPAPESDDDGDGWGEEPNDDGYYDCDDTNINTYPYAAEIYDGSDNDCDGEIDEGTDGADDDGDTLTEAEGDCDDNDPDTYPGAFEEPDLKDNDCDGEIDEGTPLADDDGDGFAETDNDCDDDDPEINPAATEICDGIDNNCNGLKDSQEGCVASDSEPMIIGGIQMGVNALGQGECTIMTVFVFDADGQTPSYAWQQDSDLTAAGHDGIDDPTAQTISWCAPELDEKSQGEIYSIYVVVTDEDGNQDWAFDEITVFPEPVELSRTEQVADEGGLCKSKNSSAAAVFLPIVSLLGLLVARRREDDEE